MVRVRNIYERCAMQSMTSTIIAHSSLALNMLTICNQEKDC